MGPTAVESRAGLRPQWYHAVMGRKRFKADHRDLRGRWCDNRKLVDQIIVDAREGKDWTKRLKPFLVSDSEAVAPRRDGQQCSPDLRYFHFDERDLSATRFEHANFANATAYRASGAPRFSYCNLTRSKWNRAELSNAQFHQCNLHEATFSRTSLQDADFSGCDLRHVSFRRAQLQGANFAGVDLRHADLTEAHCDAAIFTGAKVYGTSLWNLKGTPGDQSDLVISHEHDPRLTVDNLEMAQFIHMLVDNRKVRDAIDSITAKVVLILGRFSKDRLPVLQRLRTELRARNLTPILFDFDKPASKDTTATVDLLARMARFIIADLTDPSSIPHELATIIPHLRTTPVQALRELGTEGYSMFKDFEKYPWVLPLHEYRSPEWLIANIWTVVEPANEAASKLRHEA